MAKSAGREAIVEVLQQLLDDMPVLARGVVREIRAQVQEYDRVPLGDHADHVLEQQERIVRALIEGRGLDAEDLRRAAALGRVRAAQGVSVEGVISAYHVGNRELWKLIDEHADRGREFLPELASMMWEAIHHTSTEIAAAHSLVARARHTQSLTMRHRFMELLDRADDDPEILEIAAGLGFDPDGPFLAACIDAGETPVGVAESVHEELEYLDGVSFAVQQGALLLVLAQGPDAAALTELAEALRPTPRTGVGLRRTGLAGARESIRDAVEALAGTDVAHPVAGFADSWWLACVAAQASRLEPVLGTAREVVADNPHLVAAVRAFADAGFSVAAAAKELHVHANSVAYRLDRWDQLTGWNPRTFTGLVHSLAACTAVQAPE
ncbi:PucR family transcriptional regulator [Nocardioides marmoriginsengisoli]|uniref:PucR family transcriptional regulator n=1 Tax=Nocardioides marmoriginsengisoli TaxID=661483 RepID=A0A3N0CGC0_9ACTN|nr:helix-turn-helix domain-containing protein [Nocardioides marmoriginsengisoli]RNL62485.1 PucR family transcriptional regulator [Nocardioides marmoriginsengisoli]